MAIIDKSPVVIKWRGMLIPPETRKIGVATDRNSEVVAFVFPRFYQGVDLAEKTIYVDSLNNNGQVIDTVEPTMNIGGDTITLTWIVGPVLSSIDGKVSVRLRAVGDDYVWLTETGVFWVEKTFMNADE